MLISTSRAPPAAPRASLAKRVKNSCRSFRDCRSSYVILTICVGIVPAVALPFALRDGRNPAGITTAGLAVSLFVYFCMILILNQRRKRVMSNQFSTTFSSSEQRLCAFGLRSHQLVGVEAEQLEDRGTYLCGLHRLGD